MRDDSNVVKIGKMESTAHYPCSAVHGLVSHAVIQCNYLGFSADRPLTKRPRGWGGGG